MKKLLTLIYIVVLSFALSVSIFSHPGDTDSHGGHKDNISGGYHYHHGYSAHEHYDIDGDGKKDCPYNFNDNFDDITSGDNKIWGISNKKFVPIFWVFFSIFGVAGIATVITWLVCKYKYPNNDYYAYPLICFMGLIAPIGFVVSNAYNLPGILNILCGILCFIGLLPFAGLAMGVLEFVFFIPVWIYKGCKSVIIWIRDNSYEIKDWIFALIPFLILIIIILCFIFGEDSTDYPKESTTSDHPTYDYKALETWEPIDIPPLPEFSFGTYD